jgi:hypothetical protein
MNDILTILEDQRVIMHELVRYAREQQTALIHHEADELDRLAIQQQELLAVMQQKEVFRWKALVAQLGISTKEATQIAMSEILPTLEGYQQDIFKKLQSELKGLVGEWQSLNATNRVLAFRARASVKEILAFFAESDVRVCNVRV